MNILQEVQTVFAYRPLKYFLLNFYITQPNLFGQITAFRKTVNFSYFCSRFVNYVLQNFRFITKTYKRQVCQKFVSKSNEIKQVPKLTKETDIKASNTYVNNVTDKTNAENI